MNFAAHLANRSIVRLGGADRRAFLQGLISNDIEQCTSQQAIYAALLTPQGKFLHDLFIIESGEDFLIDCEAARAEDLIKRLTAYKLRAKVTLQNAAAEFDVWALWDSAEIKNDLFFIDPRFSQLGMRVLTKKGMQPHETELVDFVTYDTHRLAQGVADGSRDLVIEKSTLTDGNFDSLNGISWTKGCYIGQELTARMHYRALVKKRIFPMTIEGTIPDFDTPVMFGNDEIGNMRSAIGSHGLALLNIEKVEAAIKEKAVLLCGESRLSPSKPAWVDVKAT